MAFVRFTRDKRGYEHVYLVHAPVRRGKPGRPRVLYWYRSPPGVKVGREAFDVSVREALQAQYPDIVFEWEVLAAPPPPPPEVEPWRERRRLQKARRARGAVAEAEPRDPGGAAGSDEELNVDEGADTLALDVQVPDVDLAVLEPEADDDRNPQLAELTSPAAASVPQPAADSRGRRRRRGGRRRGRPGRPGPPGSPVGQPAESPGAPAPSEGSADPEPGDDNQ